MRRLLVCGLFAVAACQAQPPRDWRAAQIEAAEAKIRTEVADPTAQFSRVQLTGDEHTGQTCGQVAPTHGMPGRFIVFIDGTAGPYIEGGRGPEHLSQDAFADAWYNNCVSEGYAP